MPENKKKFIKMNLLPDCKKQTEKKVKYICLLHIPAVLIW